MFPTYSLFFPPVSLTPERSALTECCCFAPLRKPLMLPMPSRLTPSPPFLPPSWRFRCQKVGFLLLSMPWAFLLSCLGLYCVFSPKSEIWTYSCSPSPHVCICHLRTQPDRWCKYVKQASYEKNWELSFIFLVFGRDMDAENYFSTTKETISPDYKWQLIVCIREAVWRRL